MYGACNDANCLPPTQVPFQFSGKVEGAAKEAAAATAEMKAETQSAEQETCLLYTSHPVGESKLSRYVLLLGQRRIVGEEHACGRILLWFVQQPQCTQGAQAFVE